MRSGFCAGFGRAVSVVCSAGCLRTAGYTIPCFTQAVLLQGEAVRVNACLIDRRTGDTKASGHHDVSEHHLIHSSSSTISATCTSRFILHKHICQHDDACQIAHIASRLLEQTAKPAAATFRKTTAEFVGLHRCKRAELQARGLSGYQLPCSCCPSLPNSAPNSRSCWR